MKKQGAGISIVFLILLLMRGGRALNLYMRQQAAKSDTGYAWQATPIPIKLSPTPSATPVKPLTYTDGDIVFTYPGEWEVGETDDQYVELVGLGIMLTLFWEHLEYDADTWFDDDSATKALRKQLIQDTEQSVREMLEGESNELISFERTDRSTIGDYRVIGYAYEADVRITDTTGESTLYAIAVPSVACEAKTICYATYLRIDGPSSQSSDWRQLSEIIGTIRFGSVTTSVTTPR